MLSIPHSNTGIESQSETRGGPSGLVPMVDWVTCVLPHVRPILAADAFVECRGLEGDRRWSTTIGQSVPGRMGKQLLLASQGRGGSCASDGRIFAERLEGGIGVPGIRLSGNLAAFLQGHNAAAPAGKLVELVARTAARLHAAGVIQLTAGDALDISKGLFRVSRLDLTAAVRMGSIEQVRAAVYASRLCSWAQRRSYVGRLSKDGRTCWWAQGSTVVQFRAYSKGDEVRAKVPEWSLHEPQLAAEAETQFRMELQLGRHSFGSDAWACELNDARLGRLWSDHMGKFRDGVESVDEGVLVGMTKATQLVFRNWSLGLPADQGVSRTAYYRARSKLFAELGADVTVPRPIEDQAVRRVPLSEWATVAPWRPPEWVRDRGLLWDVAA